MDQAPARRHSIFHYLIVLLLLFAVIFAFLELGARWWIRRSGDPLLRANTLLETDAKLGWRQRPNLRREFYGTRVRTNEQGFRAPSLAEFREAKNRILVLGPSSAFGWGVEAHDTYSAGIAESLLGMGSRVRSVAVLNAGEIGYSSWQGLELFRNELATLQPRIVVIGYGVNDVDHFRFYFQSAASDAEELGRARPQALLDVMNFLNRSQLVTLLQRLTLKAFAQVTCAPTTPPQVRVNGAKFQENIQMLAHLAASGGAKVALLTTPIFFPMAEAGISAEVKTSQEYYRESAEAARAGKCADSRRLFEEARTLEPLRVRAELAVYNERIRTLAKALEIPLIDAENLFRARGELNSRIYAGLFADPVHPSPQGHRVITDEIVRVVRQNNWLE